MIARLAEDVFLAAGELDGADRVLRYDGGSVATARAVSAETVDVATLARAELAGLDAATRARILAFAAATTLEYDSSSPRRLARSLAALRDLLREWLPPSVVALDEPLVLAVESLVALDDRAFFVTGWAHAEDGRVERLSALSPEGTRVELLERATWLRRPDIEQAYGAAGRHGFGCYFELDGGSVLDEGWILELHAPGGDAVEARAPAAVRGADARGTILASAEDELLLREQVAPAMARLQAALRERVRVERVIELGAPPEAPSISVVVPLYGRLDLIEHQLAQLADDPDLPELELVYVLDSPQYADTLEAVAAPLAELYRVPLRLAVLSGNGGFALANNLGVSVARGRVLVLMNSDVLPARRGWAGALREFYDATPGIGTLGPKLLYEDDSLQHAGLHFVHRPESGLWTNAHYFKGLHRLLPAANVTRRVPAVTAACLMVARDLFESVGGFSDAFVQGDNEDSDLCLRLAEAGYEHWYLPEVELYHLEGQSYPSEIRKLTRRYNDWLQTELWGERMAETIAAFEAAEVTGVGLD